MFEEAIELSFFPEYNPSDFVLLSFVCFGHKVVVRPMADNRVSR